MKNQRLYSCFLTRILRVFFFLLYHPLAWSYDLVAWVVSWGRWHDWVKSVLPFLKGPLVLELGHGPGHLQVTLNIKGISALGMDASRQMGQQASRHLIRENFTPLLICGYAQYLPFPEKSFDQIVATFPTEYIYAQETLSEIYRCLKIGGNLVVLPTAWITGKRLIDRGTAALFRFTGQAPELPSHPGWESQWLEPFRKAGFQTEVEMIHQNSWSVVILFACKPS